MLIRTAQAGEHLQAIKHDSPLALPETDKIEELCQGALEVIEQATPDDEKVKRSETMLLAAAKLRVAGDNPPTAEMIAELIREGALVPAQVPQDAAKTFTWTDLQELLDASRQQFS